MPKIPTYDLEALNWTEIIAVGFFDGTDYHEFIKTYEEDDVVWRFLQFIEENCKGIKLYAHNAARYDAKFLLAKLQEKNCPVRLDAGLARMVWLKPRITFEDSYIALPGSLKSLCEGLGTSRKLEWEHEDTDYPWVMPERSFIEFRSYLKRDCLSLSEVMEKYCEKLLVNFQVIPGLTLALTSVKAFDKNFYPVSKIDGNEEFERQIRAATYGGRNEVYKLYGENLHFYDARSMFMSCYDVPVPVGKLLWTTPNIDYGTLAYARVKIPKDFYVGLLPHRLDSRPPKLLFPVGIIEDWWDTCELRFAAEQGCDLKILKQLRAEEEPILKGFGDYVYSLRLNSTGAEARLWKLFGLRLSGKFGQSRWQSRIRHIDTIKDFTGSYPIDEREEYHEFTEYIKGHRSPYIKPAISMRVRAEARIRHAKLLLEALSRGNIYYCDTDSIVCDSEMPTGQGLGELKLVNEAVRGYFIQPKFYGYVTNSGILHQTTAGFRDFRLDEEDFKDLLSGKKSVEGSYLGLTNWKKILEEGEVRGETRHRKVSPNLGFKNRRRIGRDTKPIPLV